MASAAAYHSRVDWVFTLSRFEGVAINEHFLLGRASHAVFFTLMTANGPLIRMNAACFARWFSHVH